MRPCPECYSNKIYRYKKDVDASGGYGPDLLPKLNTSWLSAAKFLPVICADCGLVRFYASDESRQILKSSEHWDLL